MLHREPAPPVHFAQFIHEIGPPRYSEKATVRLLFASCPRPLYSQPALPSGSVGQKSRARTVLRDEYIALSAHFRAPKSEAARRISAWRDESPPFGGAIYFD